MVHEYQEQLDIILLVPNQTHAFNLLKDSSKELDNRQIYHQFQLHREELAELRFSQAKLLNKLEKAEFYPAWNISKKSRKPISEKFKFFNYIKYFSPGLWDYFRKLAIDLNLLR